MWKSLPDLLSLSTNKWQGEKRDAETAREEKKFI